MLILRKRKYVKTTNSNHSFKVHKNQIKNLDKNTKALVMVCDITYIKTDEGKLYLHLVTEQFTKKILGYKIVDTLQAEESIEALQIALKQTPEGFEEDIYAHSDQGIQYACHEYKKVLRNNRIIGSMTEENHCYENAVAERVNGILKDEFDLNDFPTKESARKTITQSIHIYNSSRLHQTLNYITPDEAFSKKWSAYFRN